jgi:hypothetical protein
MITMFHKSPVPEVNQYTSCGSIVTSFLLGCATLLVAAFFLRMHRRLLVSNIAMIPTVHDLAYPRLKDQSSDIRLLVLERGNYFEPISCSLHTVDFDILTTPYEALSYEWRNRKYDTRPIHINGVPYRVRENLYAALLALRRSTTERVLWIDALCIHQRHTPEKNIQLPLMTRIYCDARDVLVWLGPSSDNSDKAIQFLQRIGELDWPRAKLMLNRQNEPFIQELEAVAALCSRSYWGRLWIVPEIESSKAATLHCGSKTIPWEIFTLACRYIYTLAGKYLPPVPSKSNKPSMNETVVAISQHIRKSLAIQLSDHKDRTDRRLIDWLSVTKESLSSKRRDRVYALLGLSSDALSVKPDTSEEKTMESLYEEVMAIYAGHREKESYRDVVRHVLGLPPLRLPDVTRDLPPSRVLRPSSSWPVSWVSPQAEYYCRGMLSSTS